MRSSIIAIALLFVAQHAPADVTIEECVTKATDNYPLIKKYELVEATRDIELQDINKSWLPRIEVYGQATVQNIVPAFPEALADVLKAMGQENKGLGKLQYKAGVDLQQTIWDGGVSSAGREMARAKDEVERAAIDVEMYKVRQRVENLYFAILLTDENIAMSHTSYHLVLENLNRMQSMLQAGTAMQSDVDMLEAQSLSLKQRIIQAENASAAYRKVLELFIGESLAGEKLVKPSARVPEYLEPNRPELKLFDRRLNATNAMDKMANTSIMPRVGLFAQAYYGYPGFDYFKSMRSRDMSLNLMAGIKLTWNIDSFYTRKNTRKQNAITSTEIETERDVFLFNTNMQSASVLRNIDGLKAMMTEDSRIIELRKRVRIAAESQLRHGIVDATTLLSKITDENIAQLNASLHEIQLLQEIYNLKYILDR